MLRTKPAANDGAEGVANLLFGAYRHRVLSLLYLRPGDHFHVRKISRLTGVPAGSLHRELRQLAEAGLLIAERSGNQLHYSANSRSPIYQELSAILDKTAGDTPTLHDTTEAAGKLPPLDLNKLKSICRKFAVSKMSLFGSAARDELKPGSDVDLLVEFKPQGGPSLWGMTALQDELSPLFGNRVIQLAGLGILENPYRRATIEPDLKILYPVRARKSS